MKNKGFSLIEIIVAVALIGLMAGVGIPKLRKQMAIGKDTTAITILENLRLASELYYVENNTPPYSSDSTTIDALSNLKEYLDNKTFKKIENGFIDIGGYRTLPNSDIKYGGKLSITFDSPNTTQKSDGVYIWFGEDELIKYDTRGNLWIDY